MFKWLKLIRWLRKHRKAGVSRFSVLSTSDTIIITTPECDPKSQESRNEKMLRIKYK